MEYKALAQGLSVLLCCMAVYTLADTMPPDKTSHPLLYFSKSDIADLREKSTGTHAEIYSRLKEAAETIKQYPEENIPPLSWDKFTGSWNVIYGNNLPPLALYCVLNNTDTEALELAITSMERLASYKNWRVKKLIEDDVPVAHVLVGIATAYDFLYSSLSQHQQILIGRKIKQTTENLFKRSFRLWWGKAYIQNHVATNNVAILTGALVIRKYAPSATKWILRAHTILSRTMFLLSQVTDGSLTEGVAYGSYTTRSLTQYLFLVKRHLGIDMTDNVWLRQHFWFFYRTILPRFDGTIGIADSNNNWFYGPESHLVFLDSFVNRNGNGNWLASQIRKQRDSSGTLHQFSTGQRFVMLHTEFIFYDNTIPEREPPNAGVPSMHIFDDWGVVVYGYGVGKAKTISVITTIDQSGHEEETFLSFKCGVLHGRAINKVARTKPYEWSRGWHDFNPGHEHPDQGSFTFYPGGRPFITETLYGPKYTWLDNAILFGPTNSAKTCSGDYAGQFGDCYNWLQYNSQEFWEGVGEIKVAALENGYFFTSGEFSGRYDKKLELEHVYRSLVLVQHDVLIVTDTVRKSKNSSLNKMSAFFHSRHNPFIIKTGKRGERFAEVFIEEMSHKVHWVCSCGGQACTLDVQSQKAEYEAEYLTRSTHFLNITSGLQNYYTSVAYIFSGPNADISFLQLRTEFEALRVSLSISGIPFEVTTVMEPGRHLSHPIKSFHGYAKIAVAGRHVAGSIPYLGRNDKHDNDQPNGGSVFIYGWLFLFSLLVCVFIFLNKRSMRTLSSTRKKTVIFSFIIAIGLYIYPQIVQKLNPLQIRGGEVLKL